LLVLNSPDLQRVVESGKDWSLLPDLPKPEPIQWRDDFEQTDVGDPPDATGLSTSGHPETLAVSDEAAASGGRSLKFARRSSGQPPGEPLLYYDLHFTEGMAVLCFDVRLEAGAVFRGDLRDERVGPNLLFQEGKLRAGDRELIEVPEDRWFNVQVEAPLGGDAGTFDIAVTLPGEAVKRFEDIPFERPGYFRADRCFFLSYGTEEGSFFLDNIRIEERL